MRWFKPKEIRSSIYALLTTGSAPAPLPPEAGFDLEDIRECMLAMAGVNGTDRTTPLLRRIRYASDLETLWFVRGELMALLARSHGEAAAREKIEELSAMFTDLPRGLRSRPSPLSGTYRNSEH
jgi:hypothetical protein